MPDYQGNAKKNKPEEKPEKNIEKVVVGDVIVQKKSIKIRTPHKGFDFS